MSVAFLEARSCGFPKGNSFEKRFEKNGLVVHPLLFLMELGAFEHEFFAVSLELVGRDRSVGTQVAQPRDPGSVQYSV
ncbi:hypothetical protein HYV73_00570 [Candidatus Uhrbacteria bacterium]|nr:hypothetical protein [Candidatus Uhrbacteria bacterium]